MQKLSASLLFFISIFLFTSCQKQLEFDTDGISVGTLKANAGGDCLPSNVNGIYKADSILTAENYIDVQINIANPGTYNIISDSINGYSFKKAGIIGVPGLQTIRLYGTGKPISAGADIFTVTYGTSSCKIAVNVAGSGTGVAVFTLSGAPDTCTNFIVTGNYEAGKPVTAGEFLTLTVDVTNPGTYNLLSNNNGGLSFSGSGFFTNTGLQNVTLNAVGTPVGTGEKYFNILHSVGCPFRVLVYNNIANYSFSAAGGNCLGSAVAGNYVVGTPLTAANTVTLNVNVSSTGSYSVSANNNGVNFTATGNFTSTGSNTILLKGTGTPLAPGDSTFYAGCNFVISFTGGTTNPPTNNEYLPMTTNTSFKTELVGGNPEDTSFVKVLANNITLSGNSYRIFQGIDAGGINDSVFYRKDNGKYYEYHIDSYGGLDNDFNKDGLLLDSSLAVNAIWTVDLGNNTLSGVPVALKYEGKILEKNASGTIAGVLYNKIIKVQLTYKLSTSGAPYLDVLQATLWFAKGKGMIYKKVNDVPPTFSGEIIAKNIYVAP